MKGHWRKIGIVGKAHGLRGAFFIGGRKSLLPNAYTEVLVGDDPNTGIRTRITGYHIHKNRVVLTLAEMHDRTRIEFFTGQALWVAEDSALLPLEAMIGRPVVDCQGEPLGIIADFYNYGASDTVQIVAQDQRTLEIPYVDSYFASCDSKGSANQQQPVALRVPSATFAELWEQRQ